MADLPKMVREGKLLEKQNELKSLTVGIQSRVNTVAMVVQPTLELDEIRFEY